MKRSEWMKRAIWIIAVFSAITVVGLIIGAAGHTWETFLLYALIALSSIVLITLGYEHTHTLHANSMQDIIRNMGCGIPPEAVPEDAMRQAAILLNELSQHQQQNMEEDRLRLISRFLNDNSHTNRIAGTKERLAQLQRDILKMEYPGFILVHINIRDYLSTMAENPAMEYSIDDYHHTSELVIATFEQYINRRFVGYCSEMMQNYVCLVNLTGYSTEALTSQREEILCTVMDLIRSAQQVLESRHDIPCFCSIGQPMAGIESIHEGFDLVSALDLYARLVEWPEPIIVYDYLPAPDPETDNYRSHLRKKFFNLIMARNLDAAEETLVQMISPEYFKHPENALNYRRDILIWLGTAFDLLEFGVFGNEELHQYMTAISKSDSIEEITCQIHNIFELLLRPETEESPERDDRLQLIRQYIEQNYTDPDLSLTSICEVFHISNSYLSHIFKQATGVNILQYIHARRLRDVKRLLAETDMTLADISQQTGYPSGWTMTRAFKRYEGITPNDYRNSLSKDPQE